MSTSTPNIEELHKSAFTVIGPEGNTNFGIIKGSDGSALLIDADIRRIDEIETALKETGCSEVRYLFNTHENFDHSSANDYFAQGGATVIASEGCWQALQLDGEAKFAEMTSRAPELKQRFSDLKMGMPHITFPGATTVHLPGVAVRLVYRAYGGQSHSRGDAVAILDEQHILFAGDILYTDVHPVTIYGSIPNWIRGIDALSQERFSHVVPGHGPVSRGEAAGKAAFATFQSYLQDFHDHLGELTTGRAKPAEVEAYMKSGRYADLGKTWMVKRNIDFFLKGVS